MALGVCPRSRQAGTAELAPVRAFPLGVSLMQRAWVVLFLASSLAACGGASKEQAAAPPKDSSSSEVTLPADSTGIETTVIARRVLPDYLNIPGKIQPDPTSVIHVYPPLGGRVTSVEIRPGDHVHKGQELALLDSADVAAARSDFQKARADSDLKQKALDRAADLYQHKAIAEKDYQQAVADAQMSKSELDRTRTQLKVLGVSPDGAMDKLAVTAPRDAVVLDVGAAPGEFSKSLDAPLPLCTLADLKTVWALGDVFEKDLVGLKAGAPAEITANAYPGQKWDGRVGNIGDAVDPVTRTLKLRVILANPGEKLKPEMFASIRILRATLDGIAIPASSVLRETRGAYVFVQKSPVHFEKRSVTLGRTFGNDIEVLSGLQQGESVVTNGALLLRASES